MPRWGFKNMYYIKLLIMLLSIAFTSYSVVLEKDRLTRYVEERVHKTVFIYRLTITDGVKKESFALNGHPVNAEEYYKARVAAEQAEVEERCAQVQEKDQALAKKYDLQRKARVKIAINELKPDTMTLEEALKKVYDPRLIDFWKFSSTSITGPEELTQLIEKEIPQAYKLIACLSGELDVYQLDKTHGTITQALPRVIRLFNDTVENAIDTCTDTRVLKELLTLLT